MLLKRLHHEMLLLVRDSSLFEMMAFYALALDRKAKHSISPAALHTIVAATLAAATRQPSTIVAAMPAVHPSTIPPNSKQAQYLRRDERHRAIRLFSAAGGS
jgi:hypothetical protein